MQSIFYSLLLTMMMCLICASNLTNKWTNEDGFLGCWTANDLNRHLKIKFRYLYSSINLVTWKHLCASNGNKFMKESESEIAVQLHSNLIIIGLFNHVRHTTVLCFCLAILNYFQDFIVAFFSIPWSSAFLQAHEEDTLWRDARWILLIEALWKS